MLYKELKETNRYLESMNQSMQAAVDELVSLNMGVEETNSLLSGIKGSLLASNKSLTEIGESVAGIKRSVHDIERNSADIATSSRVTAANTAATAHYSALTAHYSAVTAHYAKVNAELTDALGFMVALK